MFKLSKHSKNNLAQVHPDLVKVVLAAIKATKTDFGVICGVRTLEEQEKLFASGATKTMKSSHLPQSDGYSHAVDLMAYVGSRASWEITLYDDIADAMKTAARELDVHVRWGGAWSVNDIRLCGGSMERAMESYIDLRRSQNRRPFVDGPHFELRGY